jgi:hypothetical protein
MSLIFCKVVFSETIWDEAWAGFNGSVKATSNSSVNVDEIIFFPTFIPLPPYLQKSNLGSYIKGFPKFEVFIRSQK